MLPNGVPRSAFSSRDTLQLPKRTKRLVESLVSCFFGLAIPPFAPMLRKPGVQASRRWVQTARSLSGFVSTVYRSKRYASRGASERRHASMQVTSERVVAGWLPVDPTSRLRHGHLPLCEGGSVSTRPRFCVFLSEGRQRWDDDV